MPLHSCQAWFLVAQVHFFKDFDSSDKFRITGRHENSMLPSHFQVLSNAIYCCT